MIAGDLVMLENISPEPCSHFRVGTARWASLIAHAELVLHSHPGGQPVPSLQDQRQQLATGLPWYVRPRGLAGFFFGDGAPGWHLVGRPYRFGVTDCFGLVRDALRELYGVRIGNYPREWGYAKRGEAVFERWLEAEGFEVVSRDLSRAQPGDGLLFRIHAQVANHCGLVIDGGRMLHHPTPGKLYDPTTLSVPVPVARWGRLPVMVCRHA